MNRAIKLKKELYHGWLAVGTLEEPDMYQWAKLSAPFMAVVQKFRCGSTLVRSWSKSFEILQTVASSYLTTQEGANAAHGSVYSGERVLLTSNGDSQAVESRL